MGKKLMDQARKARRGCKNKGFFLCRKKGSELPVPVPDKAF